MSTNVIYNFGYTIGRCFYTVCCTPPKICPSSNTDNEVKYDCIKCCSCCPNACVFTHIVSLCSGCYDGCFSERTSDTINVV